MPTRRLTAGPASYQRLLALTIRTTDSITGTSIRTPTTVASAAPEEKPKLEEVAGADQGGGRRNAVRFARGAIEQIGEA